MHYFLIIQYFLTGNFSLYISVMSSYDGKCDNCNKLHPDKAIPIVHDKGNGSSRTYYWCLECLRNELHKEQ